MKHSPEEIGQRMDALHVWGALLPFNWAVKPSGTVFPYFCSVLKEEGGGVRVRFLMLEGWRTMHDYVRTRADANFGFCSSPTELPHLEMIVLESGETALFRHDPGFLPVGASAAQRELAAKILWESYGIMLRIESDPQLPMKYAEDRAVFARVENPQGEWRDEPLVIPDPAPHVEKISFEKADVKRAQDLPFESGSALEVDFRLIPGMGAGPQGARLRSVYQLIAVEPGAGAPAIDMKATVPADGGIRQLWESMPPRLLKALVGRGRIPGEIKVQSGRVFRFLRPLCMELPFKLSLHDSLPELRSSGIPGKGLP